MFYKLSAIKFVSGSLKVKAKKNNFLKGIYFLRHLFQMWSRPNFKINSFDSKFKIA